MYSIIWALIRSHVPATLIAMIYVLVTGLFVVQRAEINHLRQSVEQCHTQGEGLKLSNAALVASLKEQNAAVQAMYEDSIHRKNNAEKALQAVRKKAIADSRKAQELRTTLVMGDECVQLKALLALYSSRE